MMAKGVTCSNCHEPHGNALVAEGNAVCTQCHNPTGRGDFPSLALKDYDTPAHHHHKQDTAAAQCVNCHMPERAYMMIDKRRDHFFRDRSCSQGGRSSTFAPAAMLISRRTGPPKASQHGSPAPTRPGRTAPLRGLPRRRPLARGFDALAAYARDLERPAIARNRAEISRHHRRR
jgi:predicted CXXCH cytochrome family protein